MATDPTEAPSLLEAVYYPSPAPSNAAVFTFLGLVFDRIHFPNVYLPDGGYDTEKVKQEINRIAEAVTPLNYDTRLLLSLLHHVPDKKLLSEICHFTGAEGQLCGGVDKETTSLAAELQELIYGPPPEGFVPTVVPGYHKQLPDSDAYIDYPGPFHYPTNALLYAARNNLPVINDRPDLPVLGLGAESPRNNAKLLAAVISMECAAIALPKLRPLKLEELVGFRHENSEHLRAFRQAMLSYAWELNAAITNLSTNEEVTKAARFLYETKIEGHLRELKRVVEEPSKKWYGRAYDATKQIPTLVGGWATLPWNLALAQTLSTIAGVLHDVQKDADEKSSKIKRSGLYYLLALRTLDK